MTRSNDQSNNNASSEPDALKSIDELCDDFEARLNVEKQIPIEDYLGRIDSKQVASLLAELLAVEIQHKCQRGIVVDEEDYRRRFSEYSAIVNEAFQRTSNQRHKPLATPSANETTLQPSKSKPTSDPGSGGDSHDTLDFSSNKTIRDAVPIRTFGDYELFEELGRGGMGVVYKARQVSLNRTVAIKMIASAQLASAEEVSRFKSEAQSAARLDHPNIVKVFEIGEHEGRHFFSMDFVDGSPLSDLLRDHPLSSSKAATLVRDLAQAIAHAHNNHVLHRDIKPANILIDDQDRLLVTDFGLAKQLDSQTLQTMTGQAIGTPAYMPPEQARGDRDQISQWSDVYAIGAVLYHMLTGHPPFQSETIAQTMTMVQKTEPIAPRKLNPAADRDLETICLKCLEKEPQKRYATASELHSELQRFLDGKPIVARPLNHFGRFNRWCRRNPGTAGLASAIALLLIVSTFVSSALAVWAFAESDRAIEAASRERAALEEAQGKLDAAERTIFNITLARVANSIHESPGVASAQLEDPALCPPRFRDLAWGFLYAQCRRDYRKVELPTAGFSVLQSQDGSLVLTGEKDGSVRIENGEHAIRAEVHADAVEEIEQIGEEQFASCSRDGSVALFDSAFEDVVQLRLADRVPMDGIAFDPRNSTLIVVGQDGYVRLYDVNNRRMKNRFRAHRGRVLNVEVAPNGKSFATSSSGPDEIKIWDTDTLELLHTLNGHESWVFGLSYSSDGSQIASCAWDGTVRLWNAKSGTLVRRIRVGAWGNCVEFSHDNSELISGWNDGLIRIHDARTGKLTSTLAGHGDQVNDFTSIGSDSIASTGSDGTLRFWHLESDSNPQVFGTQIRPTAITIRADAKAVAIGLENGAVMEVDLQTGASTQLNDVSSAPAQELVYSGSGTHLAVRHDRRVTVWQLQPRKLVRTLEGKISIALSPNGRKLAVGESGNRIRVVNLQTGVEAVSDPTSNGVYSVSFSNDGKFVATASEGGTVNLFDAGSLKHRKIIHNGKDRNNFVSISTDGCRLLTAGAGKTAIVWDVESGARLFALRGHDSVATRGCFSPDGETILTSHDDGSLAFWDATNGQHRGNVRLDGDIVRNVPAVARDGTIAIAFGSRFLIYNHDLASGVEKLPDVSLSKNVSIQPTTISSYETQIATLADAIETAQGNELRKNLVRRALIHASVRNWNDAIKDVQRIEPQKGNDCVFSGAVCMLANRPELCRILVTRIMANEAQSSDLFEYERAVKLWAIAPDNTVDRTLLSSLATRGTTQSVSEHYAPFFPCTEAMLRYRFADFDGALESIAVSRERNQTKMFVRVDLLNFLIEALCKAKQRKTEEAVFALDRAEQLLQPFLAGRYIPRPGDAHDWLIGILLYEEALQVLKSDFMLDTELVIERVFHMGRANQWRAAADQYAMLIAHNPSDQFNWHRRSAVLAELNDIEEQRQHCQALLAQFEESINGTEVRRTVQSALFLPGAVDDLSKVRQLVERAIELENFWSNDFTIGLLLYREGSFGSAKEVLVSELVAELPIFFHVRTRLLLAGISYQLGDQHEALRWLEEAQSLGSTILSTNPEEWPIENWHDCMFARAMEREIVTLVKGPDFTFDSVGRLVHIVAYPAGCTVRYSLDGSEPTAESPLYESPIQLEEVQFLKARVFYDHGLPSAVSEFEGNQT